MKIFLTCILLYFCIVSPGTAQSLTIENSEIKEVKVFFQGAEITREFTAPVPKGRIELRIKNLSSALDPKSIIISSNSSVKVISLHSELNYENKFTNDKKLDNLKDSINNVLVSIKYKTLQYESLEEEKKTLQLNSIRVGNSEGLSVVDMDKSLSYMRKKMEEINLLLLQKESEKQNLNVVLQKLQANQMVVLHSDSSSVANVYVLVESTLPQNANFKITYYVKSCGWAPVYNIYSKGIGSPLDMEYKANVLNNSGENWKKVHLSLLAGNPSRSLSLPAMETWVLSYTTRKRSGKNYGVNQSGNEGDLSKKQIKTGTTKVQQEVQEIEVEEGEMVFNIEGDHTIPTSQREYLIDISRSKLDVSYLYQTVPKIDTKAYLIAKINDWERLKLIEGNANIFLNDTYVGRTYLDPLAAGDTLELSLGPDPAIQISRVKKKDFSTRKLIGLQLVESFTYEIDVRNLNNKPILIEVFDQIPIAQQEEIQISLAEKTGAEYQESNGKLSWKLEIPEMQTVKIKIGYSVRYPRDKVVIIKRTGRVICPKFRT
jgi:uncharacterized protein (TIGR02231 family)